MIKYTVGEVIRRERKKQGLSQELLSDGICTPSWLSKIESGACIPTNTLFEALMQRLGKNSSQYVCFKSEIEMKIEHLKLDTRRHCSMNEPSEAIKSFTELKVLVKEDNRLDQQFILLYEILLFKNEIEDHNKILDLLYQAIHYSIPEFSLDAINDYLLSNDEIVILNNLAISYKFLGELEKAISILKSLKQYIENPRFDYDAKRRTYPLVLYNLAKWQRLKGDFIGCMTTCDNSIDFCIKGDTFSVLPELLFNKGCALAEIGGTALATKFLTEAYHLFNAKKEDANAQHLKEYIFETYQLEIG
jgi:transcriptional regulator with XRE-family HTH domain